MMPAAFSQTIEMVTIRGTVTDVKGDPLPGVNVFVANTNYGASTDEYGRYALRAPRDMSAMTKIRFSLMGMKTTDVAYDNREQIDVQMKESPHEIEELVITGVHNIPRNDMVGSYTPVKLDDVKILSLSSIDAMLQGQVAGMSVIMPSMRPGAAPQITIRGQSTLLGSSQPLWVVDGIIQPPSQEIRGNWDAASGDASNAEMNNMISSRISWLNPDDIETITVLKDASATAIYGSRASNGVIVITTRKGTADHLSIRASANITIGQQPHYGLYNLMNSQERINFSKEAYNEGVYYQYIPITQIYTYEGMYNMFLSGLIDEPTFISRYNYLETVNTNWLKLLTRPSFSQNYNVNASGGTQKSTYVTSLSYSKNDGTEIGSDYERFTGRIAVGIELSQAIRVDASISGSLSKTNGFSGSGIDPIGYAISASRAIPAYHPDGSPVFYQRRERYAYNDNTRNDGLPYNIMDDLANTASRVDNPTMQSSLDLKWKLLPCLTWQTVAGYIVNARNSESWMGENSFHVIRGYRGYRMGSSEATDPLFRNAAVLKNGGILITDHTNVQSYNVRTQFNFSQTFDRIHRLNMMAMWEVNSASRNSKYNTVFGYDKYRGERVAVPTVPSELKPINENPPTDYTDTYLKLTRGFWRSTNFTDNKASLAMIVAYSLNQKYVLNANFRNDWSNTFGQNVNKRFNPAYSVGVSWKLSEEMFMDTTRDWLSVATFRLTYGTQGNVANTQTTEMILTYQPAHPIIQEPYSSISRIANPYMSWERTQNWNFGLDLGFFGNRMTMVFDGYTRLSNVGRTFADTPENGGFSSTLTGTYIRNTGIEGAINITPLQTESWKISLGANFSKNWNIIAKEEQSDATSYNTNNFITGASDRIIVQGYPLGAFWAYAYAGPDPDTGIPTFHGIHSRGYTADERTLRPLDFLEYAGTRISDISSGLNLRVAYKNLFINASFAATLGGKQYLYNPYGSFSNGRMPEPTANLDKELLDRWTKDNRDSNIPGLYVVANEFFDPIYLEDPTGITADRYRMWSQSDDRVASMSSLRCRNISLTWNINRQNKRYVSFLERIHARSIDLQASVHHVFLIADSKWNGMDPEMGGNRKMPRSYTMGVTFSF